MNKILKLITIFYRKIIPISLRQQLYNIELRVSCWYNPLLKNRVTRYAVEDLFEASKKELAKKYINLNITYNFHKVFRKHLVRSNLIDNQWWSNEWRRDVREFRGF